ncbi:hypothetical protein [Holospora undulata]|nr:hypothetical protein [Holospora undulata]
MKVVIDAVDKIHGDVVPGLGGIGRNNAPQSLFLLLFFGGVCL